MSTHTVQTLETFQGGVTSPLGFTASGQYVGIKAAGRGLDLALIGFSDEELEDLLDLRAIREARADPENQKRRSFFEVAKELGWERPTTKRA